MRPLSSDIGRNFSAAMAALEKYGQVKFIDVQFVCHDNLGNSLFPQLKSDNQIALHDNAGTFCRVDKQKIKNVTVLQALPQNLTLYHSIQVRDYA